MTQTLFERELARHDWDALRQPSEDSRQDVPVLLGELVSASSDSAARAVYLRLEGCRFPQRLVTQSSAAVVARLAAFAPRWS